MNKPVSKIGSELLLRLIANNIETNITKRWEEGKEHHLEAEKLAHEIGEIDWMFCSDSFCFKFGGDGDNGENLVYLLDILFELRDKEGEF